MPQLQECIWRRYPCRCRGWLALVLLAAAMPARADDALIEAPELREVVAGRPEGLFSIAGLPQHSYSFDADYEQGRIVPLRALGTVGFVIQPTGQVDPARRWLWISNLFLALHWPDGGGVIHRYTVERALASGFHVVGLDVGASLGSPAGSDLYARFHRLVVAKYGLSPRARMLGHSNGGLIALGFAFRHSDKVERILGIFPATDFRSWPGLDRVAGPGAIAPRGLSYDLELDDLARSIQEFNPIDNLGPLAQAKIPLYHIHGTADDVVPLDANTTQLARRYRDLGGAIEVEIVEGGKHGGQEFYTSQTAAGFLVE